MRVDTLKPFGKSLSEMDLSLTICETNKEVATTFAELFEQEKRVEIVYGDILNVTADALVSPANSFGDMSGGLDKAIDDFYAREAQPKVQQYIRHHFFGEIPVGTAAILRMHSWQYPHLIVAPTMRIPGNVSKSINAYLAMRAVLQAVLQHNFVQSEKIRHIALPALCTGVGGMPYRESAEQMLTAIHSILDEDWKLVLHPAMAPYALGPGWMRSEKLNKYNNTQRR